MSEDGNYLKGTNDSGKVIEGVGATPSRAPAARNVPARNSEHGIFVFKGASGLLSGGSGANGFNFKIKRTETGTNCIDAPPRPKNWLYKLWPDK